MSRIDAELIRFETRLEDQLKGLTNVDMKIFLAHAKQIVEEFYKRYNADMVGLS